MSAPTFTVLPGLPGDGPRPIGFSPDGHGLHREGHVVEFHPSGSTHWVGNFGGGVASLNAVLDHPNGRHILVVSRGQGYLIDLVSRELTSLLAADVTLVRPLPATQEILAATFTNLELVDAAGLIWRSRRISWDGIDILRVSGSVVTGQAWRPFDDSWHEFRLDLISRIVEGGSYADQSAH